MREFRTTRDLLVYMVTCLSIIHRIHLYCDLEGSRELRDAEENSTVVANRSSFGSCVCEERKTWGSLYSWLERGS